MIIEYLKKKAMILCGLCVLEQDLLVDFKMKLQMEKFRRFAAEDHALQKDLKIIHDGTDLGVDGQG